jgi:hypothetical protein
VVDSNFANDVARISFPDIFTRDIYCWLQCDT